jgi:hypothetical protein
MTASNGHRSTPPFRIRLGDTAMLLEAIWSQLRQFQAIFPHLSLHDTEYALFDAIQSNTSMSQFSPAA